VAKPWQNCGGKTVVAKLWWKNCGGKTVVANRVSEAIKKFSK